MFFLKKLVSALLLPPIGPLLVVVLGLALAARRPRLGRALAALGIALLVLLSLPWTANRLIRTLETSPPVTASDLARAQAIVVLGGGSYHGAPEYGGDTVSRFTLERLRYGARLARQTGLPVLVTGGAPFGGRPEAESMRETLEQDFGVQVRWAETASRDTAENAVFSAALLRQAGITRIALVTHAWHMPRAAGLFERQGVAPITVIAAPTGFIHDSPSVAESLLPAAGALGQSHQALHEWLGRLAGR
ncbi:MAG: YdcF family protein [Rhodocyclaceae bacterium]|nr:YdcF family protein [Rhodocyclaceae bacterium]